MTDSIYVQHIQYFSQNKRLRKLKMEKYFRLTKENTREKRVPKVSNKNAREYKLLVLTLRINVNLHIKYIFKVNIN